MNKLFVTEHFLKENKVYLKTNVFPLKEAYKFSKSIGGKIAAISNSIEKRHSIPNELIDSYYGQTSQARRALVYVLFKKYRLWNQFTKKHWPLCKTNNGNEVILELESDYINNGLLERYRKDLPQETWELFEK